MSPRDKIVKIIGYISIKGSKKKANLEIENYHRNGHFSSYQITDPKILDSYRLPALEELKAFRKAKNKIRKRSRSKLDCL